MLIVSFENRRRLEKKQFTQGHVVGRVEVDVGEQEQV